MIFIINSIFQIINIAIISRVILSWVQHNRLNPFINIIYQITNPILKPIQKQIPPLNIGIDISPIIAMFLIQFLQSIIIKFLITF